MRTDMFNIGQTVLCDWCNAEYQKQDGTLVDGAAGGILVGSKAVCPRCMPRVERGLRSYGEERYIKARCPEGMTFAAWCISLRGGNNTITVTSLDAPCDCDQPKLYIDGSRFRCRACGGVFE